MELRESTDEDQTTNIYSLILIYLLHKNKSTVPSTSGSGQGFCLSESLTLSNDVTLNQHSLKSEIFIQRNLTVIEEFAKMCYKLESAALERGNGSQRVSNWFCGIKNDRLVS